MTHWLVLDVNGLAYRAFHTTGSLRYKTTATGVLFGILGTVLQLQEEFGTNDVVWCFDYGKNVREEIYPEYKSTRKKQRKELSQIEKQKYWGLRKQLRMLQFDLLKLAGYQNVFYQKGYEADDVIASVVLYLDKDDEATIVSSDSDMFQLLSKNVRVYNPRSKEVMSRKRFINKFGIKPGEYPLMLALAGCHSDDVKGIPGVGEKTALAYLKEELKHGSKYKTIETNISIAMDRNMPLVMLPYRGTKKFVPKKDGVVNLNPVYRKLGFKSMMSKVRW